MGNWVRGEDEAIQVYKDGKQGACVNNVVSFSVSVDIEAILRDYLGDHAPKPDMIYKGVNFDGEIHHDDPSYLTLVDAVTAIAQHRTPGVTLSIGLKISYPSGQRVRFMIRDIAVDPMNLSFGGRTENLTSKFSGKARQITNISGATPL